MAHPFDRLPPEALKHIAEMLRKTAPEKGMRQNVRRSLLHEWNDEWSMPDFLKMVQEAIADVPKEDLAAVKVEISGEGMLNIVWERPETDDEIATREAQYARYARDREEEQRRLYLSLKAKFEPSA